MAPGRLPRLPEDGSAAWSLPRTRNAWRAYAVRTAAIGAVAAALAAVFLIGSHLQGTHDARMTAATSGVVVDSGNGGDFQQSWVRVRYQAAGVVREGKLNGPNPNELAVGEVVGLSYDPQHPDHFRSADFANHSNAANSASAILLAVLALISVITVACCVRLARWRWQFARAPWQVWNAEADSAVPGRGSDARWIVFTTQPSADSTVAIMLGLQAWLRFQEAVTRQPTGQTVWYLPGPHRRGVILPSDSKVPISVRLPRSHRAVAALATRMGRPGRFE